MTTENATHELIALFATEDASFEATPFVTDVMVNVKRRSIRRRIVLSIAALVGGVVAGTQVPSLLADTTMINNVVSSAWSNAQHSLSAAESINPLWLASIVLVTFCSLAITMFERT